MEQLWRRDGSVDLYIASYRRMRFPELPNGWTTGACVRALDTCVHGYVCVQIRPLLSADGPSVLPGLPGLQP
jgi:hypothetical protein